MTAKYIPRKIEMHDWPRVSVGIEFIHMDSQSRDSVQKICRKVMTLEIKLSNLTELTYQLQLIFMETRYTHFTPKYVSSILIYTGHNVDTMDMILISYYSEWNYIVETELKKFGLKWREGRSLGGRGRSEILKKLFYLFLT